MTIPADISSTPLGFGRMKAWCNQMKCRRLTPDTRPASEVRPTSWCPGWKAPRSQPRFPPTETKASVLGKGTRSSACKPRAQCVARSPNAHSPVIVRLVRNNGALGRTIHCSRDVNDKTRRPRRTGYPAFAPGATISCFWPLSHPSLRAQRSNPFFFVPRGGLLRFARNDAERPRCTGCPTYAGYDAILGQRKIRQSAARSGFSDASHAHVKDRFPVQIDND